MGFGKLIKKLKFGKEITNEHVAWIQGLCNLRMTEVDRDEWEFDWGFDELRLNGRVAKFDGVMTLIYWINKT